MEGWPVTHVVASQAVLLVPNANTEKPLFLLLDFCLPNNALHPPPAPVLRAAAGKGSRPDSSSRGMPARGHGRARQAPRMARVEEFCTPSAASRGAGVR